MNRGITRWFPLRDMDRFFDDESFWEGADFVRAINVYQDKDNVMVETSPGRIIFNEVVRQAISVTK